MKYNVDAHERLLNILTTEQVSAVGEDAMREVFGTVSDFLNSTAESANDKLMEALANIEHQRWADWQKYMHSKCTANEDGTLTIPAWAVTQWNRQINTPYSDLSEQEKESDREQVRRYWSLIRP